MSENTFVEHVVAHDFTETLTLLEEAIMRAGMTIFARIDHASAAQTVGLTMPPTTVLIYGNPRGGTPIMLATPRAAIDLPLRVLVREDEEGRVRIGFHPIAALLRAAGVADADAIRLAQAQALVVEALKP